MYVTIVSIFKILIWNEFSFQEGQIAPEYQSFCILRIAANSVIPVKVIDHSEVITYTTQYMRVDTSSKVITLGLVPTTSGDT